MAGWAQNSPEARRITICQPRFSDLAPSVSVLPGRDVVDWWAGWAVAHPGFGKSVTPISTRGGRLCPPHTLLLAHPALGRFLRHFTIIDMLKVS